MEGRLFDTNLYTENFHTNYGICRSIFLIRQVKKSIVSFWTRFDVWILATKLLVITKIVFIETPPVL